VRTNPLLRERSAELAIPQLHKPCRDLKLRTVLCNEMNWKAFGTYEDRFVLAKLDLLEVER